MKLTDYLAQYIVDLNVKHVFLVIGGASAHIVDSIGRNKNLQYVCTQHEQAAGMAADAYARLTKNLGVAVVTSGPGATNLITGLCCAYFDSTPCLFISGQVNEWETKGDHKIRQLGFQETNIVDIVRPITKYAALIKDPGEIKYHLDKAVYLAKSGRPGPVWLDIPMNVQHAEIDPSKLFGFDQKTEDLEPVVDARLDQKIQETVQLIVQAARSVILVGGGIKFSSAEKEFRNLVEKLDLPVVSSWSGIDVLPHDHKNYFGQIGVYGNRGANFIIQNSDLLLSIGSRLDTRQTGGQPQTFARGAKKIVVDIDQAELTKNWVTPDLPIQSDAKVFLATLHEQLGQQTLPRKIEWLEQCQNWKKKYPAVLPEYYQEKIYVNPYVFMKALGPKLGERDVAIADIGGILTWTMQALEVRQEQQLFSALGHGPMGYALPAAIGASFAAQDNQRIFCLTGDGGMQMSIQELQTVVHYKLPIKIFVLNNHSYGIIKQFQEIYFESRYEGTVEETGYSVPDFVKIGQAYGLESVSIKNHEELEKGLEQVLSTPGPVVCDVWLDPNQKLIPKLIAVKSADGQKYISKPLEDMSPLLPREEFLANMIVAPLPDDEQDKPSEVN